VAHGTVFQVNQIIELALVRLAALAGAVCIGAVNDTKVVIAQV
jgi:hypothetical protein